MKTSTSQVLALILLSALLNGLVACAPQSGGNASTSADAGRVFQSEPEDAPALRVNGEVISQAMLARMARARGLDLAVPEQREQVQELAIESLLLAQSAISSGLLQRPDIRTELDLARMQTLAARDLGEARAAVQLSDEQLRQFYQEVVAQTGDKEIHLRNALYADEEAAKAAAQAAAAAPDFVQWLAGAEASGAQQAGDLGWANPTQLPPQLLQAVLALPDGGVSASPIQTRFGWHVVQRVASRDFSAPAFEQVRDGIRKQAEDKHLEERLAQLRAQAKVETMP